MKGGLTSLDAAESGDVEMTMVEAQERVFFFWGGGGGILFLKRILFRGVEKGKLYDGKGRFR